MLSLTRVSANLRNQAPAYELQISLRGFVAFRSTKLRKPSTKINVGVYDIQIQRSSRHPAPACQGLALYHQPICSSRRPAPAHQGLALYHQPIYSSRRPAPVSPKGILSRCLSACRCPTYLPAQRHPLQMSIYLSVPTYLPT